MATRKSVIGATLSLDKRGFTRDLNSATREGRAAVGEMGKIKSPFGGVVRGIHEMGKSYQGIKGAVGDFINSVKGPLSINADYQDMRDKLTAIEGSAESAKDSLAFLTGVSITQAMALEPLVEGQARLVSLGYSAENARDMIREIANAAEQAGAGAEVILPVVGALEKIDEKGEASVKALMQFGDTLPILRQILDLQFGVKTAADLEKLSLSGEEVFAGLLAGLKQVETATASDNEKILASDHLLKYNPIVNPGAELPNMTERQVVKESPEDRAKRLAALQQESAARRDAAARLIFTKEQDIAELEITLAKVRQGHDDAAINAAEEKLALARDLAKVMQETGASQALATDHIKAQVMAARELEKATTPKNTTAKEAKENLAISTLRAQGKTKQADKLEAEIAQRRRQKELTDGGVDPATAASIATQERKNTEDEARFAATGRRRIRGAKTKSAATSFTGLDHAMDNSAITPHMFDQSGDGSIGGYKPRQKMDRPQSKQAAVLPGSNPTADPAAASLPILKSIAERMSQVLQQLKTNSPSVGSQMAPAT
jgi:hypothetical protein